VVLDRRCPSWSSPLAKLGNFFYGLLLLLVVLVVPEGVGRLFEVLAERLRPRRIAERTGCARTCRAWPGDRINPGPRHERSSIAGRGSA
jgi:hypothetical protein